MGAKEHLDKDIEIAELLTENGLYSCVVANMESYHISCLPSESDITDDQVWGIADNKCQEDRAIEWDSFVQGFRAAIKVIFKSEE